MKIDKIGVQLYTIRNTMTNAEDIRESFKKIKDMGYDLAQTAGCPISYEEFGQIAKEEGIEIVGTHEDYNLMCNDFEKSYANHQALGTKLMGVGMYLKKDFADYIEFVKNANEIGEKITKLGGKFTYHNHAFEFARLEGNDFTTMDYLIDNMDKDNTSFVLDTHWVQRGGGDVCQWIKKLTDRIDILHLKDYKIDMDEDLRAVPTFAEVGYGNLNWEAIMEAAEEANVKYYVVEQDLCNGDPFDSLKMSADYLRKNYM